MTRANRRDDIAGQAAPKIVLTYGLDEALGLMCMHMYMYMYVHMYMDMSSPMVSMKLSASASLRKLSNVSTQGSRDHTCR